MNNEVLNNYNKILKNINEIKNEFNITDNINLLPVSKTKSYDDMKVLIDNNINTFGENYVKEILEKNEIDNNINFHLIGHLQTNKINKIIDKVSLIESVDSIKLCEAINKEAEKKNIIVNILLEVNVACEETKFGFKCKEVEEVVENISNLKNINVCGLMTSAPYVLNPDDNEVHFKKLKNIFDKIKNENDNVPNNINFKTLSMGMSNDYKVAIRCGSNEIRIGTDIFGKRNYNK